MFEYKSEVIMIPYDMIYVKGKKFRSELAKFDAIVNQHASEGWELTAHSFTGLQDLAKTSLLMTFRRQKD